MSTINLLPEDYVERRLRKRANTLCLTLFGVVMTAVVGAVLVSEQSASHTRQVRDEINASYAQAATLIEQMQELKRQKAALMARAEQAAALLERVPRSYLLGVITNACPEHAALVSMNLETCRIEPGSDAEKRMTKFEAVSGQRFKEAQPSVVRMQITGLAATDVEVARFIANLARNPLLASVDLVYSEERMVDKMPIREFQVKLELRPNLDVIDVIDAGKTARADRAEAGGQGGST